MLLSRSITQNGVRCGRILIKSLAASSLIGEGLITPSMLWHNTVNFIVFGSDKGCSTNYWISTFLTRATTWLHRSRHIPQHCTEQENDANNSNNLALLFVDHVGTMSRLSELKKVLRSRNLLPRAKKCSPEQKKVLPGATTWSTFAEHFFCTISRVQ
jgi:hypothetical protein